MKVMQINNVFRYGSTGKIVNDICDVLVKENIKPVVCYGRRRVDAKEQGIYKYCSEYEAYLHHALVRFCGMLKYGGVPMATLRLIKIIESEKPDLVHVHCVNDYCVNIYRLLHYLGTHKIKTVVTNHAEFFYTGSCAYSFECDKWKAEPGCGCCPNPRYATGSFHSDNTALSWKKMKEAFSSFDVNNLIMVSVSPWTTSRAVQSPITRAFRQRTVENGVDTKVFHFVEDNDILNDYRELEYNHIIFHATSSFSDSSLDIKGGRYVIELARKMPEVLFVVATNNNHVNPELLPRNVVLWGRAKSQLELAKLYSAADLTLLCSGKETFSMVTAESLCCGTPVVGFKAGGPESIALSDFSIFVEYGDELKLEKSIRDMLVTSFDKRLISAKANAEYSKERMAYEYIKIYKELLNFNFE